MVIFVQHSNDDNGEKTSRLLPTMRAGNAYSNSRDIRVEVAAYAVSMCRALPADEADEYKYCKCVHDDVYFDNVDWRDENTYSCSSMLYIM